MKVSTLLRRWVPVALALLGVGCGGGGGGGNGVSDSGNTGINGLNVTTDTSSIRFVGYTDSLIMSEQTIRLTLRGAPADATYFTTVVADQNVEFDAYILGIGQTPTSREIQLRPIPPNITREGKLTVKLCTDAQCGSVVWSKTIPYQSRVYDIDRSSIKLAGDEGVVSMSRQIGPTKFGNELMVTTRTYSDTNWLSAKLDGSILMVSASAANLPNGNHQGTVFVAPSSMPSFTQGTTVTFTIGPRFLLSADKQIDWNVGTTANVSGTIDLAFHQAQSPEWQAFSSRPWLVLHTTKGTGAGSVAYTIDASKLATSVFSDDPNSETANVTFAARGVATGTFSVTVKKK